ncbi:hypothetical protein [Vineibacter terrae]|uniref:hypothetical protein n=1 Tax=Vineibacter terrae TaxID=2586908 RepID=UPI002E34748B|nr:hypothetical protein [Vineibacter terrae]HEX2887388.1 hypothetical protein [Vineibacter terrae]
MFHTRFRPKYDVLYGVSDWRDKYLDKWIAHKKQEVQASGGVVTVGMLLQLEDLAKKALINYYNQPITMVEAKFITSQTLARKILANVTSVPGTDIYIDELLKSRYSPISVRDNKSISRMPKNDNRVPGDYDAFVAMLKDALTKQTALDAALYLAIRRACKFGIEYVMEYRGGTIHYIIDGITMADVVGKTEMPINMGLQTGVPITTSELRFIFRNWHWFREKVDDGLVFWFKDTPTTAPWITDPKLWIPYAAQRIRKYKAAKQGSNDYETDKVNSFEKYAPIDPALAIEYFGMIKMTDKLIQSD